MKKIFTLLGLFCCLLFASRTNAQLGEYSFTQTFNTYTPLATTNIPLDTTGASPTYYRRNYKVTFPFSFTLGNITSDTAWVDLSGFMALKLVSPLPPQVSTFNTYPLSQMSYYAGVIAPLAGPFAVTTSNLLNSGIRTDVSGTTPYRIFTIEWRNINYPNWNIQVKLHETTNVIDFCYNTAGNTNYNPEIGLRLADTSIFTGKLVGRTNYKLRPGTNIPRYARLDSTVVLQDLSNKARLDYYQNATLPNNLQFTWTPPAPCDLNTANLQLPDTILLCAGQNTLLTPTGFTQGLTYQWQISTNGTTWNNVTDGDGPTNFQYRTARLRDTASRWYRLKATCTATNQVVTSNAAMVKASAMLPPYFEGFEGLPAGNIPSCIASAPYTNSTGWTTLQGASYSYNGTGYAKGVDWVYTPGVFLEPGKQYRFSHYYKINNYIAPNDSARIGVGTLPTPDAITNISTVAYNPFPYNPNTPGATLLDNRERYHRMETIFTVPTAGIYFGGIQRSAATVDGSVDDIEIRELSATDVMVDSVLSPTPWRGICFNPTMPITIKVSNTGTQPVSNIPVSFKVVSVVGNTIVSSGTETIAQTIAPGTSIQYTFTQLMSIPNPTYNYKISAWSALTTDDYKSNDTSNVNLIQANQSTAAPYIQSFETTITNPSILNFDWSGNGNTYTIGTTGSSSKILRTNFQYIANNGRDSVNSITVTNITSNTFLRFQYRMANASGNTATMNTADTIYVVAEANCGSSRDTLMKVHAGMQTNSSNLVYAPTINVGQFAGDRLRIRYITRKASNASNFYFDIDSFQLINIKPVDIALTSIREMPSTVCVGNAAPVKLSIKNLGGNPASGFAIKALVNGQPSSLNYIYPGNLEYQNTDTISIGALNFNTAGTYDVKLYAQQANDTTHSNDTLYRKVFVVPSPVTAQSVDSTFCGSGNLAITTPDSTVAFWYKLNPASASPVLIGDTMKNITTTDSFSIINKRYTPLSAGRTDKHPNWSSLAIYNGYGLAFDAHSDIMLDSVGIYPSGTGSVTIDVVSCASCTTPVVLATRTYNFTNANGADKKMVPVNVQVNTGKDYAIRLNTTTGLSGLMRDFPFTGFPLSAPGSPVTITSSLMYTTANYDYYYYFYDWKIKSLSTCAAPAAKAKATIGLMPNAAFNTSVNGNKLSVSNLSTGGGTYEWTFGDGASSTAQSPTHTYATAGTYTVTLVLTNDCGKDTLAKNITIKPTSIANVPAGWTQLTAWPNPATNYINVSFTAAKASQASVSLMDGTGRIILQPSAIDVKEGENLIQYNMKGIAPGTYMLILSTKESKTSLVISVIN